MNNHNNDKIAYPIIVLILVALLTAYLISSMIGFSADRKTVQLKEQLQHRPDRPPQP